MWKKTERTCPRVCRDGLWKQVGNSSEFSHFILKVNVDFALNFVIFVLFILSKICKVEMGEIRTLFILGIIVSFGTCLWVTSSQFLYLNLSHNSTEKKSNSLT